MRATRCRSRLRNFLIVIAALAASSFAVAPAASAQESAPTVGTTQVCVGVKGGFLVEMTSFGVALPPNTTVSTTLTFSNGHVISVEGTTDDTGRYDSDPFHLDLRDPEIAALVNTFIHGTWTYGTTTQTGVFPFVGCPTAPDGRVACLDGGYEHYALGFLNQGDCVSWVATKGKNEPGQNQP